MSEQTTKTAQIVREVREHLGETQWQFARRFNVNQSSVDRWEQGGGMHGPTRLVFEQLIKKVNRERRD